jgi:hypothetical protein
LRLTDIVSPAILEAAIHRPKNDDPAKDKAESAELDLEVRARHQHVEPLAKVLANCMQKCGVMPGVDPQIQLDIEWTTLAAIDAAIELATKESV